MKTQAPTMDAKEIRKNVFKRLEKYENKSTMERYALFMGVAQILEFDLKRLLIRKYGYDYEKVEKDTLGWTKNNLKEAGVRRDFIELLERVVEYRNYVAHNLLVDNAILKNILDNNTGRLETKHLDKGIYELEQIVFLYEWCEKHDEWD